MLRSRSAPSPSTSASSNHDSNHDPYDLDRFCSEQRNDYARALNEIRNGSKRSCWMWYCLPTAPWVVNGVERGSWTNKRYALRDLSPNELLGFDAAQAYLKYTNFGVNLRSNYLNLVVAIVEQFEQGITCKQLMGSLDAPKLKSNLELFRNVTDNGYDIEIHNVCNKALLLLDSEKNGNRKGHGNHGGGGGGGGFSGKGSGKSSDKGKGKQREITNFFTKTKEDSSDSDEDEGRKKSKRKDSKKNNNESEDEDL